MINFFEVLKGAFKIKKLFLIFVFFILFFSIFFIVKYTGFVSQTESTVIISGDEEPPVTPPEIPSSGGGGGGTSTTTPVSNQTYDFILDKNFLAIELEKGEYYQTQITADNIGAQDLEINVSVFNLEQFIFPENESFILEKQKTKIVNFDIYALKDAVADVYIGKINFVSEHVEKYVNVILDIKDKFSLFDIKTTVLKKYIVPGRSVTADVFVLNLVGLGEIEVEMEYGLMDFDNRTYVSKKEILLMNDSISKTISMNTLEEMGIGQYVFYSKVSFQNMSASSYDTFVLENISMLVWIITLSIIGLVIILIIVFIKRKKDVLKNEKNKN